MSGEIDAFGVDGVAAFHFVEERIVEWLRPVVAHQDEPHVVDLGCGIGASLCYLAQQLPLHGTGVTLSPVQVRFAEARIASLGLSDRVRCVEGDYTALPSGIAPADLAYAIESFVHGPSPERFRLIPIRVVALSTRRTLVSFILIEGPDEPDDAFARRRERLQRAADALLKSFGGGEVHSAPPLAELGLN